MLSRVLTSRTCDTLLCSIGHMSEATPIRSEQIAVSAESTVVAESMPDPWPSMRTSRSRHGGRVHPAPARTGSTSSGSRTRSGIGSSRSASPAPTDGIVERTLRNKKDLIEAFIGRRRRSPGRRASAVSVSGAPARRTPRDGGRVSAKPAGSPGRPRSFVAGPRLKPAHRHERGRRVSRRPGLRAWSGSSPRGRGRARGSPTSTGAVARSHARRGR